MRGGEQAGGEDLSGQIPGLHQIRRTDSEVTGWDAGTEKWSRRSECRANLSQTSAVWQFQVVWRGL